jgi:hypothetical protein
VTLYQNCWYGGARASAAPGGYNLVNTAWDNAISALQIPTGWAVTLYDGPNFSGRSVTLRASVSCLYFNGFSDIASSLVVGAKTKRMRGMGALSFGEGGREFCLEIVFFV